MSDDEDDDVAIAGEQEAEVKPGDPEPGIDDETYDPDAEIEAAASAKTPVVRAGRHPVSKQTRALLAKAVADLQTQREIDPDEEDLEYDEPEHPAPGDKRVTPAANGYPPGQVASSPTQLATPPAPSLDPAVQQIKEQYQARHAELDAREKALVTREQSADVGGFGERYAEKPVEALRDWLKARGVATTDDEWKDEAADLVTDLSGQVLGVPIPSEIRNRIDARRALRAVKLDRQSRTQREAELQRKQQETEQSAARARAVASLGKELAKPEHASAYPWLLAEDSPADLLVDVVEAQFKQDGTSLTWVQAAKRANDYLEHQAVAYSEKRRHLLERLPKPKNNSPQRPPGRPPGPTQVIRTKQTNGTEAPEQQEPPARKPANPRNWNEEHRRNTKRMMRAAFKPDS